MSDIDGSDVIASRLTQRQSARDASERNTCESYLREKNEKEEKDGEHECPIHGEKIELFCQTDEEAICATCKKQEHRWHQTQKLQQAVRQRKGKLKAALRSVEKSLVSLQKGTERDPKISRYIQRDTFHSTLNVDSNAAQMSIFGLTQPLFDDNYHGIMDRTHYTFPDQELSSETLTDVSKHLGNLKYQVWETMKNICSYYPVILNPNVAPPDISVSDDLTSVTSCLRQQDEPNPLHLHRSRVVLGSVGFTDDFHA
ncbi:hypothetical protein G5714_001267 [Onychostoma macrolepis]|uniref:B box-type domain-containing protein n=1 Tax=Onychostoma macrolepis TaxID=369639 RepID=A0A7J6DIR7_9TELE|nr:hypothetical protein G5714_001267 [Onychostoma macrolepis]